MKGGEKKKKKKKKHDIRADRQHRRVLFMLLFDLACSMWESRAFFVFTFTIGCFYVQLAWIEEL